MAADRNSTPPEAKKKDRPLSALDRQIAAALGEGKVLGHPDDPARERWPALWDWLSRVYVGRDHVKSPAVVTIRLVQGGASASITDRDLCSAVDVTCPSLEGLLDALDAALARPDAPLRTWGKKEPHLRKRQQ